MGSNLLRDMCGGMGAPFLGSDDSLYGLVDDDSTLLGLVLGATLSVSLGLFTVALCHYLGVARLWMYPAYTLAAPACRYALAVFGRLACWYDGSYSWRILEPEPRTGRLPYSRRVC